ncbi:hypothetical protein HK097_009166 [Rhizophlyctis rosea]|uniref:Uncharacterized protein n=1 Tax=Rhizophlyctis rosea TaxID=64517 RepID=A0AAD5S9A7_9FUNG|nr:hypothetical protein HK097_009166 [Rhizophlyctis rosea]
MCDRTLSHQILLSAINQLLRHGSQPQSILDDLFTHLNTKLDTGAKKLVVYNNQYGGFGLTDAFKQWVIAHGSSHCSIDFSKLDVTDGTHLDNVGFKLECDRVTCAILIEEYSKQNGWTIQEGLKHVSASYAQLAIKEVPAHREFHISDYDGQEGVSIKTAANIFSPLDAHQNS